MKETEMSQPIAVKAIIYDQDGRFLLQHRDNVSAIGEPDHWSFFGGGVEKDETLMSALERELQEELSCKVGQIEAELFRWERCPQDILNVCFAVKFTASSEDLILTEGQGFAWFSPDELVGLPLGVLVHENMSHLLRIASGFDSSVEARFELAILRQGKLHKKNERVFYALETPVVLSRQLIMLMKELAEFRGLPVFRVCMHENDNEGIHEMLMVHTRPVNIGPLKQDKTSLSYHMLDGVADILLHDDAGVCNRTIRVDSNDNFCGSFVRLKANVFRSIQTISPHSIFLEVASGPFADNETVWLNKKVN